MHLKSRNQSSQRRDGILGVRGTTGDRVCIKTHVAGLDSGLHYAIPMTPQVPKFHLVDELRI